MTGWKYFANRMNGDGTETLLASDLSLDAVALRDDLSGPGGIQATLKPNTGRYSLSQFVTNSTAIYAEKDGMIRAGAILAGVEDSGPELKLDCVGFSGKIKGEPHADEWVNKINIDPLDAARHIWQHYQSQPGGNIGLLVDSSTSTPIRIGKELVRVEFTTGAGEEVAFDSGPYSLGWWKTGDLGKEFDDLAIETPFDYMVTHERVGDSVIHKLTFGYPTLGRRNDRRFVVGENVTIPPVLNADSDNYASQVIVHGAGEGRAMIRGESSIRTERLRRVVVVEDKTIESKKRADLRAETELRSRAGQMDLSVIEVANTPYTPIGSFRPGDEITVSTRGGWSGKTSLRSRILSMTTEPATGRSVLEVARTERTK